jgi:hypothetical protein
MKTLQLTPWSTVLFDRDIIVPIIKNYTAFMKPQVSPPVSKTPVTGSSPDSDRDNLHPHTTFL